MQIRNRLESGDPDAQLSAVKELYRAATDDPEAVREFAPLLVERTDDVGGCYATATLDRVVNADVLEWEPWLETVQSDTRTDTERRRAADLLGWIAKGHPSGLVSRTATLVTALEDEPTRAGAMEALFHLSCRHHRSLDVSAKAIFPYFSNGDPCVRGDAVAIVGQIAPFGRYADDDSYRVEELIKALTDTDSGVRHTAMGILNRNLDHWPHQLLSDELRTAIERVGPLRANGRDPKVRSFADSLYTRLAFAVIVSTIESALGIEGSRRQTAADALVRVAAEDRGLTYKLAKNVGYQARSHNVSDKRRDEILDRLATQHSDRFESGETLHAKATDDGGRVPDDRDDLVFELLAAIEQ